MRMAKVCPDLYDFFPKTWVLPNEANDFRNHFASEAKNPKKKKHQTTYIVKPDGMCQGKGIFLSRNLEHIIDVTRNNKVNHLLEQDGIDGEKVGYVVQEYMDRPHLVEDLKYDFRLYVLLYGVNPLRIFLH